MDDLNALERQIEGQLNGYVGPVLPVDDAAIFNDVTAATRSQRWGFTMFSALKFVVAAVIVALFGSILLMGILTTPQGDDLVPAAVTGSPSPMTTEALLAGMVTEEVEPGVFRAINDRVRDLSYPPPSVGSFMVDVTPDGSVWPSANDGKWGLFGLGEKLVLEGVEGVYISGTSRGVASTRSMARDGRCGRPPTTHSRRWPSNQTARSGWWRRSTTNTAPTPTMTTSPAWLPAFDRCRGPMRGVTEGTTTGGDSLPLAGAVPPCAHGIRSDRR